MKKGASGAEEPQDTTCQDNNGATPINMLGRTPTQENDGVLLYGDVGLIFYDEADAERISRLSKQFILPEYYEREIVRYRKMGVEYHFRRDIEKYALKMFGKYRSV